MEILGKSQIAKMVAMELGCSQKDAESHINAFTDAILKAVSAGQEVRLTGILSISSVLRAARTGRNPRTGETLHIPAKKVARLKAGKDLKDAAEGA